MLSNWSVSPHHCCLGSAGIQELCLFLCQLFNATVLIFLLLLSVTSSPSHIPSLSVALFMNHLAYIRIYPLWDETPKNKKRIKWTAKIKPAAIQICQASVSEFSLMQPIWKSPCSRVLMSNWSTATFSIHVWTWLIPAKLQRIFN